MTAVVSVALKRRVTIIAGQAPPGDFVYSHEDHVAQVAGTPFIQGNAEFGVDCPRPRLVALCPPKVAPAGSILLSVRAPVGALNTADGPIGIGRGVAALLARPPTSSRYLWWLLHALRDELSARATGSTYPAVDARAIATLPFPVLSPQAQADVAGFLDREDKRVHDVHTVLRAQVEALDGYRKGVVRDAVQRLRRRPLKYGFSVIDCKHRTPRYILEGFR